MLKLKPKYFQIRQLNKDYDKNLRMNSSRIVGVIMDLDVNHFPTPLMKRALTILLYEDLKFDWSKAALQNCYIMHGIRPATREQYTLRQFEAFVSIFCECDMYIQEMHGNWQDHIRPQTRYVMEVVSKTIEKYPHIFKGLNNNVVYCADEYLKKINQVSEINAMPSSLVEDVCSQDN